MNKRNLSIGTWLTIPNEAIAEIFAQSGFEWIVIDLEHSAININQAEKLIRVIDLAGSKPMVRLSGHDSNQIKRVLDFGAKGIIAPMVDTYEQGKNILEASKYYPDGTFTADSFELMDVTIYDTILSPSEAGITVNKNGSIKIDTTGSAYEDLNDGEIVNVVATFKVTDDLDFFDYGTVTFQVLGVSD